jgi:hypothetical protein
LIFILKIKDGFVTVTDIIKYFHEKKDDNYLAKAMIRYGKYWEE